VVSPDTFERPIYAGNAIALVQSTDAVKVITRGHLDEVPRDQVADWEQGFLTFVRDQVPELRQRIVDTKELDGEGERQLEAAIAEYKRQRAAGRQSTSQRGRNH
jgi:F0F1-type ATP synthase alpha subunit